MSKRKELENLRSRIDKLSSQYIQNLNEDSSFLLLSEPEMAGMPPQFVKVGYPRPWIFWCLYIHLLYWTFFFTICKCSVHYFHLHVSVSLCCFIFVVALLKKFRLYYPDEQLLSLIRCPHVGLKLPAWTERQNDITSYWRLIGIYPVVI